MRGCVGTFLPSCVESIHCSDNRRRDFSVNEASFWSDSFRHATGQQLCLHTRGRAGSSWWSRVRPTASIVTCSLANGKATRLFATKCVKVRGGKRSASAVNTRRTWNLQTDWSLRQRHVGIQADVRWITWSEGSSLPCLHRFHLSSTTFCIIRDLSF